MQHTHQAANGTESTVGCGEERRLLKRLMLFVKVLFLFSHFVLTRAITAGGMFDGDGSGGGAYDI